MKFAFPNFKIVPRPAAVLAMASVLIFSAQILRADEVLMQNGDRYLGRVFSLNGNSLTMQSDVLGLVQLPRKKVASITLTTTTASEPASPQTNRAPVSVAPPTTNTNSDVPASLRKLASHSNLIEQVQTRFLGDAGPEANAKFSELLNGLSSGKLNVNDLRAQAKSSADQLRELRRGLGEDEGSMIDTYLSILDKFLKESPAPNNSVTAPAAPKVKTPAGKEDE